MVSIIIRTCNEEKYILKLINAIHAQNVQEAVEIIVVDSGSTDKTIDLISHFKDVKIISIPKKSFSYGFALNQGIRHANGKIAVSISAHCIPIGNNWLTHLIEPLYNPMVGISFGRQCGPERARFSERQIFDEVFPRNDKKYLDEVFNHNANSAFRIDAWRDCPFDEELLGLEDYDYALKITRKNLKSIYVPSAEVFHFHHETNEKVFNRYYRETLSLKKILPFKKPRAKKIFMSYFRSLSRDYLLSYQESTFIKSFFDILGYRSTQYFAIYAAYYDLSKAGLAYHIQNWLIKKITHGASNMMRLKQEGILRRTYETGS